MLVGVLVGGTVVDVGVPGPVVLVGVGTNVEVEVGGWVVVTEIVAVGLWDGVDVPVAVPGVAVELAVPVTVGVLVGVGLTVAVAHVVDVAATCSCADEP